MKRVSYILMLCLCGMLPLAANAETGNIFSKMKSRNILSSLEIAANIGTTGLGLEVASPVTDMAKIRLGFDGMPHFTQRLEFGVENHIDNQPGGNFDRINDLMSKQTGYEAGRSITLEAKPSMETFRCLIDIYPFKTNRHWHVTAGFFLGGNSIGNAINTREDMATLMTIKMYGALYDDVTSEDFVRNPQNYPLFGMFTFDTYTAARLQRDMLATGQLGIYAGDRKDGTSCFLMPDNEGLVRMKTKVNRFRPYIGVGYGGSLSADGRWQASFDAGVQFWGGTPKLTAEDGTVINDLTNLSKATKSYIDLLEMIPVFPTLAFRISYRF
ncbi:MAG: hypothetical protein K2K93_08490 [Muribaculaceae bacterium]|nr:hypothetical protein [Muribaculaceae bacterium]